MICTSEKNGRLFFSSKEDYIVCNPSKKTNWFHWENEKGLPTIYTGFAIAIEANLLPLQILEGKID
jgi:hypothetical protein